MNSQLQQRWEMPANAKPIIIMGAGDIVNDAHMPAYKKAGFSVAGVFDIDEDKALKLAEKWGINKTFSTINEASASGQKHIYDIAVPPSVIVTVLEQLPDNVAVLIQKPMGENLEQAMEIREVCQRKNLTASINFQLRFSPMMLAIRDAINSGILGDVLDIDLNINISTPWELFPFLKKMKRVEVGVHSIHYFDLIRSLVGNPDGVFARSLADPRVVGLAQTRTSAILDYGEQLRVTLSINHNHKFDPKFQNASFRVEGTKGCMKAKLGALMNYPEGQPDELWLCKEQEPWQKIELEGSWFPDAFIGTMSNLQRFDSGEDDTLLVSIDDAIQTMSLVEACFISMKTPSTPLSLNIINEKYNG